MDTLSSLRKGVETVQRSLGIPEPAKPAPPGQLSSYNHGSNRPRGEPGWEQRLDARDGLLCAGLVTMTVASAASRGSRVVVPMALGVTGAGLMVLGIVGSRFDMQ